MLITAVDDVGAALHMAPDAREYVWKVGRDRRGLEVSNLRLHLVGAAEISLSGQGHAAARGGDLLVTAVATTATRELCCLLGLQGHAGLQA